MRDPNERMLMSNLVKDSPMFDYVEQIAGRANQTEQPIPKKSKKQIKEEQRQRELEMAEDQLVRAIQAASTQEEQIIGFESEEQIARLATKKLNDADLEVVRSSLSLLSEIKDAAKVAEDMEGEVVQEITQACLLIRKELSKMIEAKSLYGVVSQEED